MAHEIAEQHETLELQVLHIKKPTFLIVFKLSAQEMHINFFLYRAANSQPHLLRRPTAGLTGVLQPSRDTLHRQDERVLKPWRILARRVELHQLIGCFARIHLHDLLREMRPHLHAVGGVTDALQRVDLAHVEHRDVRITEGQPLPQVGVPFKELLVSSNLIRQKKR